jgi:hypothetical protein
VAPVASPPPGCTAREMPPPAGLPTASTACPTLISCAPVMHPSRPVAAVTAGAGVVWRAGKVVAQTAADCYGDSEPSAVAPPCLVAMRGRTAPQTRRTRWRHGATMDSTPRPAATVCLHETGGSASFQLGCRGWGGVGGGGSLGSKRAVAAGSIIPSSSKIRVCPPPLSYSLPFPNAVIPGRTFHLLPVRLCWTSIPHQHPLGQSFPATAVQW